MVSSKLKIIQGLTLFILIAGFAWLVYLWFFETETVSLPAWQAPLEIKIDLEALESEEVAGLLPFEKISLPEEYGRENPFTPY